jgi:hypothetical protein
MAKKQSPQYTITDDPTLLDQELGMTEHIRKEISDSFFDTQKKKPHIVDRLNKQIAKYPNIPQFKNFLYTYYKSVGNKGKTQQAIDLLVKRHPDYLYTRLALIEDALEREEFTKIDEMIGRQPDISVWYPDRTKFHYNEVKHFEYLVISYYLKRNKVKKAETHLQKLKELDIYDEEIETLEKRIMIANMEDALKGLLKEREQARNVVAVPSSTVEKTDRKPDFTNPLVEEIYNHGMDIDHELVRQILSLPRQTLISDLNKVIYDSIARYDYFIDETEHSELTHTFPFHVLFLLTELKAEESLQVVLEILRQDRKFTEYWFFDVLNDIMWECLHATGQNKLSELANFLKEPDRDCYHRSEVSKAISQVTLHQPERREEVINIFRDTLNYFIQHQDDERLIDTDLTGFMVGDILDMEGRELIPELTEVFRNKLANPGISGDLKAVLKELSAPQKRDRKQKLSDIYNRYTDILTWWNKNDDSFSGNSEGKTDWHKQDKYLPVENFQPKVGRNDPCPCGSGKKYKKCCIDF